MRLWLNLLLCIFVCSTSLMPAEVWAAPKKQVRKKQPVNPAAEAKRKETEAKKKEMEQAFKTAESDLYAKETRKALPALSDLCSKEYLRACSMLGFAYASGRYGVSQSTETGIQWYEKCAEKEKNFFCHNELGRIYYQADQYDKAFDYYQKGAKGGNTKAEYWLARLYLEGKGTPVNAEKALVWLRRAAHDVKKPYKPAQCTLVEMSYYGIGMRRSMKDTNYWLRKCDNAFIRGQRALYGHGVPKNREKAKEIFQEAKLNEALHDWNDFIGNPRPSVGKTAVRDQAIPEDCSPKELVFGARRKNPKIETYAVKIFHSDYYRTFDVRDGFSDKNSGHDQTFEACGTTFYTTLDHQRLFRKALQQKAVIKISVYKNACLNPETIGVCDLNLTWQENKEEEEE